MTYIGIDYGRGTTNIDTKTGIRYGVISQHTVGQAWYDAAEPDYGDPTCPKCRSTELEHEFTCVSCGHEFEPEDAYGDEPQGWHFDDGEYLLSDCLDSDIFILKSPYYTFAQFCSPCVPGAGNLDTPLSDGVKTFCLGHDWFEEERAPYPVYRVSDGSLVNP